jgi:4a-hydroxytetrahydrobiopterin dehydratase
MKSNERCEACHVSMKTLSEAEIVQGLSVAPHWKYEASKNAIERLFEFKGYYATMAFVNAVAWIAHQEKHHPDMTVSYNKVLVSYQTHEAGGITRNDLICAIKVDALLQA